MAKASELLLQSAKPFDDACLKVIALEDCLAKLVRLKQLKDEHGKTTFYQQEQPKAWRQAKHLLGLD